jgi:glycosyltransferase involved in cell wall biosynthesis
MSKIGFIAARYGEGVVGGAEAVLADIAFGLNARGHDCDVLTTCARDHFTWENVFPAGSSTERGVGIHRFPAVVSTSGAERAHIDALIQADVPVAPIDQERWMNDSVRVPELFHYVLDHRTAYDAFVVGPYMFWPTYACGLIAPQQTIFMPCYHDEPQARLDLFRTLFAGSRGIWFLSEPERELANLLQPRLAPNEVVGAPVAIPESYDPEGFVKKFGITRPFVLYAGRREGGKGWERLLEMFAEAVQHYDLPFALVTMGTGAVDAPTGFEDRVIDLGFCSPEDRNNAMAAASVYVQPSALESFSLTVLEAWLAGTLVVANAGSEVVAWHCERSEAGLLFDDADEFAECLQFVAHAPEQAAAISARGRSYVLEHYRRDAVLDAMEQSLHSWGFAS